MILKCFVIAAIVAAASAGKHDIYHKYTVHGVALRDISDQQLLLELEQELELDVWHRGTVGETDALVMVSPDNRATFLKELESNNIGHYLHLDNVVKALEDFDGELSRWKQTRRSQDRLIPFTDYPRYAEVDAYLERIAREYPQLVTLVNAGPSFEGRDIKYLRISTTNFTDTSKPVYFMTAMLHAREWVTTPVALYSIHRLVENLREADRDLREDIDWIIMPLVNPDGYEFSHTDVRLWRRTRSINPTNDTCIGVDGNRNFDVHFNTLGVSSDPCSDIYPGPSAFSEVETRYVRDILLEHLDRIQIYMDVHSFGNYVLYGFGNGSLTDNAVHLHFVGAYMGATIDSLKLEGDSLYRVGNSALKLYATSGSSQDYAQYVGVPFSYTLELPSYGMDFRVPPQFIEQINTETWQGIAATARLARLYYGARL